ncbi:S1C family serine protease [Hufsiella ginkgonis]|uniref:Trypsin-like serine protease n=1 Tax=Hufsiella ginkgonis TaxID=2695274 RepID=A0A7K1XY49_9SPHI|nr:serine protease [Hufsiella ginkgonis]MXV15456.1 trypsin-like serine protease [Hufsiella ginkgonis]
MKSETDLINKAEAYFRDELSAEDRERFEQLRENDPAVDQLVVNHFNFMKQLSDYGKRHQLLADLEDIHSEQDIASIRRSVTPNEVIIKKLWAKHRFNLAIAASVALFTLLSTLLYTGTFSPTKSDLVQLSQDFKDKLRMTDREIRSVKSRLNHGPVNPGTYGGTGFALSGNYIATGLHIVKGADSVYIQNSDGESYKGRVVYTDATYDVAILQITDPHFKAFTTLPYFIKKSESGPAEDVFTVGYPRDSQVYGKGYLSASTGYRGDTTQYQVSIDVNPGNSGGPLIDNRGNVIGLIQAKQASMEGAAFATKSSFLLKAIEAIPSDSLTDKLVLSKKNSLSGLSRNEQYNKLKKYVFMVKAYSAKH